jgi:hypothetical protein
MVGSIALAFALRWWLVRDGDHKLVSGYTLTSASGTDWSQAAPVPEPGTAVLLMATLALAVCPRRCAPTR